MENDVKNLKEARKLVNKIIKNLNRNDLDWTIQLSVNSTRPDMVNYCCQIEAPANGLQPITWVYDSWDKLIENLKIACNNLDVDAVERAWHESEIVRAETLIKYHKECLEETNES